MDYKSSQLSGSQWQRCNRVVINNHYGSTPQITLNEEVISEVGGKVFREDAGAISVAFNPDAVVELLNPTTGEPLGATMTQGQIHVALWSLYMTSALARDAAPVVLDEI